jgi:hypothetical protein
MGGWNNQLLIKMDRGKVRGSKKKPLKRRPTYNTIFRSREQLTAKKILEPEPLTPSTEDRCLQQPSLVKRYSHVACNPIEVFAVVDMH